MSSHPSISSVGRPADRDNTGPLPVWWTSAAGALLICLGWTACVWISTHLRADPALHTAALFVHLASLVLGFGAVLVADYYGLLWLTGRCELGEAVGCAARLHTPIWAGLAGLVASGIMLHPDLASPSPGSNWPSYCSSPSTACRPRSCGAGSPEQGRPPHRRAR